MNRKLATALIFITVISGVIARAEFVSDIDFKLYIRILDFSLILLLFILNFNQLKVKKIELCILAFSSLLLLVGYKEDLINFIYICFFLIVIRDLLNLKEVVNTLLLSAIFTVVLVFALWIVGITESIVWYHSSSGSYVSNDLSLLFDKPEGYRVRFAFGMNHPNSFSFIIVSLISLLFVTRKNISIFFLNLLLAYFTYYFTDSKNIIYYTVILYSMGIFFSFCKTTAIKYIPSLLIAVSVLATIFLSDSSLNSALSGRLSLWNELLSNTSLQDWLLGKAIDEYTIDNGFIHLIFAGGIFLAFYFIKIARAFLKIHFKKTDAGILAFVLAFLIFNVVEDSFLRFENAAALLFWWLLLCEDTERENRSISNNLNSEERDEIDFVA